MGKSGFPASLRRSSLRGRYLLVGFSGGVLAILGTLLRGIWTHACGAGGLHRPVAARPVQADLEFLKALDRGGRLRAVIGRTLCA